MTQLIEKKYSHLRLRLLNEEYKYVLFDNQSDFLEAIKSISQKVTDLPYSIFFTKDEMSAIVPLFVEINSVKEKDVKDWVCFHIVGEMPFGTVQGLISKISSTMNAAKAGICVVSSYKTDLFFIKRKYLKIAKKALESEGWIFA